MKKLIKPLGVLALTLVLSFAVTSKAEARKFWGNESSEIVAYSEWNNLSNNNLLRFMDSCEF